LFYLDDNQDTTESLIVKTFNNDTNSSKNSTYNTTITHHNNDEISTLIEDLNTANYEIKVLQKKLEMSNLKLLSAQQSVYEIEENFHNSIINTSFKMIHKNKDKNENHLYDDNQSKQLNCEHEIFNKHKNGNEHQHKHHHENYISDNEDDNTNENIIGDEDEDDVLQSNNIQINTDNSNSNSKSNMNSNTLKSSICPVTESDNINTYNHHDNIENSDGDDNDNADCGNHYSNGYNKPIPIPIKLSQHKDKNKQKCKEIDMNLENELITSSSNSNTITDMIEFTENQNSRLEKSKDFFFSEKIISMSKKLKILKEKLIDRRYWKQVALCVAEAAVLACASTVPIPTVDVMERSSAKCYNNNNKNNNSSSNNKNTYKNNNDDSSVNNSINSNNNGNNNDDDDSPLFSDNRLTRHLSSSRYRGSVLINEELLRTVLVMSKVCDAM
jgi:hypothetical protein